MTYLSSFHDWSVIWKVSRDEYTKQTNKTVIFYETEKKYDAKDKKRREMKFQNGKFYEPEILSCDLF